MHLSLYTDYALRVLMALAAADKQLSVDDIAGAYDISRNHLAKVAQSLQAHGYITTVRGRNGGLRLAQDPADINLGRVVRNLESFDGFVACMGGGGCAVTPACGLKGALALAVEDFCARLDTYTLADLVPRPAAFTRLLFPT